MVAAPSLRIAGVGYLLSRILEIPLVADRPDQWLDDSLSALPSPSRLLNDRIRGYAWDVSDGCGQVDEVIEDAVGVFERRAKSYSPIKPVLSAVIEATADITALMRSLDALQANTLPNWEAIVVANGVDSDSAFRVRSAVEGLGDPRVRLFEAIPESFEAYAPELQHAARADYFIRITPGFAVSKNFVAQAAAAILRTDLAQGYYWKGTRLRANRVRQSIVREINPQEISLRDITEWWYSLDGEYVMSWRMFRVFGGLSHLPGAERATDIEQIVACETAALRGILFQAELPLVYRRMASLSRNMGSVGEGGTPGSRESQGVPVSSLAGTFIEDIDVADDLRGRYSGKTVAFVRHVLVPYDARLLKEASTLVALGARVVVAGVAATAPEAFTQQGLEVFVVPDKYHAEDIRVFITELNPDVVQDRKSVV